jgi:hypothetical protein
LPAHSAKEAVAATDTAMADSTASVSNLFMAFPLKGVTADLPMELGEA